MKRYKYPRTLHLPWSEGTTKEEKTISSDNIFKDKEVVVTIKMDGENTTIYTDGYCHPRSTTYSYHSSRTLVKSLAVEYASIGLWEYTNLRVCGENLYAKHSIHYKNLEEYFLVFSIWLNNKCFDWSDTQLYSQKFGFKTVPIIYEGIYDSDAITRSFVHYGNDNKVEGYVIRNKNSFILGEFDKNVAKWVRYNHVNTDEHWSYNKVIKNEIKA